MDKKRDMLGVISFWRFVMEERYVSFYFLVFKFLFSFEVVVYENVKEVVLLE